MEASNRQVALEAPLRVGEGPFVLAAPPAEFDFGRWLAEQIPAGAPVVTVRPPGTHPPLHFPRIRPAVASPRPLLGRGRRGSAPAVHAAFLADIEAHTPREIAKSGLFDFTSDRSARQHIRDGRLTAADLGTWPWAVVDGKSLPRNWWADRLFALALGEWALGHVPPRRLPAGPPPLTMA